MYRCALILAAGEGKRMKSSMPKVLHKVCGKEMVNHVIDNLRKSAINDIDVIIGRGWEKVKEATLSRNVCYSLQKEQLGTGHAVLCADDFLKGKSGNVVILVGDGPLITESTINKLFDYQEKGNFKCTILTTKLDNPAKYGRIVRNSNGEVEKIVEFKDCNEDETKINEVNSGIYAFDIDELRKVLKKVKNNNAQNEYYLTDVIEILKKDGQKVGAVDVPYTETLAVNSRVELAQVEKVMRRRINTFHMENGVTILDPEATYIGPDVTIGSDTIIYPGNVLEGNTVIGQNCVLYPNSRIFNSTIEDGVIIQCSVILEGHVGEGTTVGPCAYIRPESKIGSHVRIGDFVEIKKSTIGDNTKVSHLTYIGDAEVGKGCNFGCGTVVVNYDGKKKNKTIIGNHSFIGCNTNLVSPVTLEDNTYTAAGSTITDKVPEGNLSIARARQVNIPGWVEKKGLKK